MKKIFAIVMTVAMILSVAAIGASAVFDPDAVLTPNITGSAGTYAAGSYDAFEPVGDIDIHWVPDASEKLNLKDGKMDDWAALKIEPTVINTSNMVAWVGSSGPEGWEMSAYFLADKDYLYIGFYIKDSDVVPLANESYRSGDAFQINIDFGGKLGWLVENSPETVEMLSNTQNVFYSFGYKGDGQPVVIHVECSDDIRDLDEDDGVIGATGASDDGWCAEFTIPFQAMYHDYTYKAYLDKNEDSAVKVDAEHPFEIGAGLYYMDFTTADDGTTSQTWAAGTHSGFAGTDAEGKQLDRATNPPIVRWDVYDNSMSLNLAYVEGMDFTCEGILVEGEEFQPQETDAPADDTDAPADDTDAPADDTDAPAEDTDAPAEDTDATADTNADTTADTAATTEAPKAEEGCASVVSFAAVAVLAAAAAVVLKKKD